jgi:hypothetical protein
MLQAPLKVFVLPQVTLLVTPLVVTTVTSTKSVVALIYKPLVLVQLMQAIHCSNVLQLNWHSNNVF